MACDAAKSPTVRSARSFRAGTAEPLSAIGRGNAAPPACAADAKTSGPELPRYSAAIRGGSSCLDMLRWTRSMWPLRS